MCEKFFMPSRRQLWRHDWSYDVMHFFESWTSNTSGTERDTDVVLSLLESTRSRQSYDVLFQQLPHNFFSKISRKVVHLWKRLDEQKIDRFWELRYLINFWRYRRNCAKNVYAEQASIITPRLQLWRNAFFSNLWHPIPPERREIQT